MRTPALLVLFLLGLVPLCGQSAADSLKSCLANATSDTTRLRLCVLLIKEGPSDELVTYATRGAALGDSLMRHLPSDADAARKIAVQTSSCYNSLAFAAGRKGDFGAALQYQKTAGHLRDSLARAHPGDAEILKSLGLSCNNLSLYSQQISDDLNAQKYAQRGLAIFDSVLAITPGDESALNGKAKSFILLGNVQQSQKNEKAAYGYFESAYSIYSGTGNQVGMAGALTNLGLILQHDSMYDEAIEKFATAAELFTRAGEVMSSTIAYNNMGDSYLRKGDMVKSRECFEKSLQISESTRSSARKALALFMLARTDTAEHRFAEAQARLSDAEPLARKSKLQELLGDIYRLQAHVYYKQGEFRLAYDALQQYGLVKDTLHDSESSRQLKDAMTKFETEQKEQQNQALLKENRLKEAEIVAQRKVSNLVIGIAVLVVLVAGALLFAYSQKRKANIQLTLLNEKISQQKEIIELRQKETTDSIHYAEKIQGALLTSRSGLDEMFGGEVLLFFSPKDIVSGDFYWAAKKENDYFLAVCDSTGHGVPGAFMSLLNISYLGEAVREKNIREPGKVFDHVRQRLTENIAGENQRDGMDGVLLRINHTDLVMQFAASFNAPVVVRSGEAIRFTPDKMPVGAGETATPFNTSQFQLEKNDMVYLFTDGYADQFGGPKGKKFKYRQLEELLLKAAALPMKEQQALIETTLLKWKGSIEQIDDILVLGFRC